jgi:hypothetical protein
MTFFFQPKAKVDPDKVQQIKSWIYQRFYLDPETSVSISQLHCSEANCPPVETAIVLMTDPVRTFKIYKAISEIESADISRLLLAK